MSPLPQAHIKTFRILSIALILSVSLNIFLIGYVAFVKLDSFQISLPQTMRPTALKNVSPSNKTIYAQLNDLSNELLIDHLKNKQVLEDGLKMRDIALGILVQERAFDIQRALGRLPSNRNVHFNTSTIPLFTKLNDGQFSILFDFGKNEQWPITSKRMFAILKESDTPDSSLKQSFMLTPAFQRLERLFPKVEKPVLLNLVMEGPWELLENVPIDFLTDTRPQFLLGYIDAGSPTAASLILKHETYFAFKRLDDDHVLKVLRLSSDKNALTVKFILSMLASPRSEEVKNVAMQKLNAYTDKTAVLDSLIVKKTEKATKPEKKYVVQSGDNLWKIARKSNISLNELLKANHLAENAILQPGAEIVIP